MKVRAKRGEKRGTFRGYKKGHDTRVVSKKRRRSKDWHGGRHCDKINRRNYLPYLSTTNI